MLAEALIACQLLSPRSDSLAEAESVQQAAGPRPCSPFHAAVACGLTQTPVFVLAASLSLSRGCSGQESVVLGSPGSGGCGAGRFLLEQK